MIAHLIPKFDYYYCSECRIKQPIGEICIFCGAIFSNYEELPCVHNQKLQKPTSQIPKQAYM